MTRWRPLLLLLATLLLALRSDAVTIALAPNAVSTSVGGTFSLDLVVSGLGDGAAPSLGSWDLDVVFDESLLSLDDVTFGTLLGGPGDATQEALAAGAGTWNVAEISLLLPEELDGLQPGSFVLATLAFSALAEGTSAVALANGVAGDGLGDALALALVGAQVEVVPEPGTALLVASALLGFARWRSGQACVRA